MKELRREVDDDKCDPDDKPDGGSETNSFLRVVSFPCESLERALDFNARSAHKVPKRVTEAMFRRWERDEREQELWS